MRRLRGEALTIFTAQVIDWQHWLPPLLLMTGGVVAGLVLEWLLTVTLRRTTQGVVSHLPIELNDRLASSLKGAITGLCIVLGIHLATYTLPEVSPAGMEIIRKLLFLLGMIIGIRLVASLSVVVVRFYLSRHDSLQALPNTSIFENLIVVVMYLLGALFVLQNMGVSVMPLITALGVGGLAISLALQDTLANMFAGINMILARQIKIGDYVRLQEGGYEGTIDDIGWRTTVIRQLNSNLVIVPNSKMASTIIINTTLPVPQMAVSVEIGVAYGTELAKVEQICLEVAHTVLAKTKGAIPNFKPIVRYQALGETAVRLSVGLQVENHVDQFLIRHEFIKRLYERFLQEGIEIPFPQRVLHLSKEVETALVQEKGREGMVPDSKLLESEPTKKPRKPTKNKEQV